jgi:uncharacterized protein Usg
MMRDIERLLRDYRLTTAEILYHMPDHPALLQSYTWQELDLIPDFPELKKFLHFWERSLEGAQSRWQAAFGKSRQLRDHQAQQHRQLQRRV